MALLKQPPLEDRIKTLRDEITAFIDARVVEVTKQTPGVPDVVIRGLLTNRAGGCQCLAYIQIKRQVDEETALRESAA